MNMNLIFDIHVSKDRLSASIIIKNVGDMEAGGFTAQQLNDWLTTKKIVFGVNQEVIQMICELTSSITSPIEIAKGKKPENGIDGFLKNEVGQVKQSMNTTEENQPLNFKNILTIPSVKSGQLIATIVPPTVGLPGKDVYGNVINAKPGKALRLKQGKNILFQNDKILATADGQISFTANSVNVFPVYEVKGDLDLNTGNVNFVGSVVVYGNVPSGFEINAGGDVKILGLVEGASIHAGGSIYISGGIAGHKIAMVNAGVDIHSQYVNQATIVAGNDIHVENFIMYSKVTAGSRLLGEKVHIIGGKISAGKSIIVGEIGNQHFVKTEICIGTDGDLIQQEHNIFQEMQEIKDSLTKLAMIKEKLEEKKRVIGKLTPPEEQMMIKQQETVIGLLPKIQQLEEQLKDIHQKMNETQHGFLVVHDKVHPNNLVTISKYSKITQQALTYVKLYLNEGEIVSVPL